MFVTLKPLGGARSSTPTQVIGRLRGRLAAGRRARRRSSKRSRTSASAGASSSAQYQYTLQGERLEELGAWAPRGSSSAPPTPQLVDVSSDQQDRGLQASLAIDRDTASRLGITPQLIDDTLYDAFGQRQVSTIYTPLNQYHVVMEVEPRFWQRPETLRDIYVRSSTGAPVPLSAFSRYAALHDHARRSTTRASSPRSRSRSISPRASPSATRSSAVEDATREIGLPGDHPRAASREPPRRSRRRWRTSRC